MRRILCWLGFHRWKQLKKWLRWELDRLALIPRRLVRMIFVKVYRDEYGDYAGHRPRFPWVKIYLD